MLCLHVSTDYERFLSWRQGNRCGRRAVSVHRGGEGYLPHGCQCIHQGPRADGSSMRACIVCICAQSESIAFNREGTVGSSSSVSTCVFLGLTGSCAVAACTVSLSQRHPFFVKAPVRFEHPAEWRQYGPATSLVTSQRAGRAHWHLEERCGEPTDRCASQLSSVFLLCSYERWPGHSAATHWGN